jgi:dihydrofolate reductase
MIKAIAAMDNNRLIGRGGGLPWPTIKEDFQWFKTFTANQYLVVRSTTYRTLPPLPNRKLLVLTDSFSERWFNPFNDTAMTTLSREDIIGVAEKRDVIVIGGAKTYTLFMDFIKEFYVTHVNGSYDGDTYMPPFSDSLNQTTLIASLENGHKIFRYTRN